MNGVKRLSPEKKTQANPGIWPWLAHVVHKFARERTAKDARSSRVNNTGLACTHSVTVIPRTWHIQDRFWPWLSGESPQNISKLFPLRSDANAKGWTCTHGASIRQRDALAFPALPHLRLHPPLFSAFGLVRGRIIVRACRLQGLGCRGFGSGNFQASNV